MPSIVDDLLRPEAYPRPVASVELIETHISWVFLAGADVYKLKKPVDLGFLDFRSLSQRQADCEAEVRLNARLAPGVYLRVVPVTRGPDHRLRIQGEGPPLDWAVHMRRLPDDERADTLLASRRLDVEAIDRIAAHLAHFHALARCDDATAAFGDLAVIEQNVVENFAQTRDQVADYIEPSGAEEIERAQVGFVHDHASLFRARVAARRIRDGHGDLRLEHVYMSRGGPVVIDCIEFSDRFRFADVCADVAFLSMDLAWHGRVDLAERLLARYAREAHDFDLYSVVDFYEAYRAYVRAKVSMLLAADGGAAAPLRDAAARDARRYLLLALSTGRKSLVPPVLVCVGGVIASGKSTTAEALSRDLSAPIVEADRTRKAMLGLGPLSRIEADAWHGAYDPALTEGVYAEVFRRAGVVLASGRPVIVDASFRARTMREAARRVAVDHGVPFRFVECRASTEACVERLAKREHEPSVSDARASLFDDFRARFEPVDELPREEHLIVDTTGPGDAGLAALRAALSATPPRSP
jgi:aminoglycoside phosphotransferase family enzyme/predicted kinase